MSQRMHPQNYYIPAIANVVQISKPTLVVGPLGMHIILHQVLGTPRQLPSLSRVLSGSCSSKSWPVPIKLSHCQGTLANPSWAISMSERHVALS